MKPMAVSVCLLLIAVLSNLTQAQTPEVVWSKTFGGSLGDDPVQLVPATNNGFFLLANSDFDTPRYWDPNVYRIDSLGDTLWSRSLDRVNVWGRDIAAMPDGGCVAVASIMDSSELNDIFIARYSASGDTIWTRQFGGVGDQLPQRICVDANDDIVVAGQSFISISNSHSVVLKVSESGDSLWTNTYNMGFNDWGDGVTAIAPLPNGGYLIAGMGAFIDDAGVPYVAQLNRDGQLVFSRYYWITNAIVSDLRAFSDGSFALAGQYRGEYFDFRGPWLLRCNTNGDSLWSYVDSTTVGGLIGITFLPDGAMLTVGSAGGSLAERAVLTRFNPNGAITMQVPYQYNDLPTSSCSFLLDDFSQDSSVVLLGRIGDSLNAPCSHCDLYVTKLTSLPLGTCGDIDGDGFGPDISDLSYLVDFLFFSLSAPRYPTLADVDSSGGFDIADLQIVVDFLFLGGTPPSCL